ncbi:MAG: HD domain-containing protein [Lachnospiraceae bacterium]|nr:HD domain-containing protein [Lachnospiraceae bacterium]MDD3661272.1 HD domain-containing protein [Lachnospiraceae bacterium]
MLSHHERWDGKGYPRGLRANEIPIPCRIFAIADSYDAMTNNRCYRKVFSKEKAIKEIEMNAGSQFDPEIAQVFVDVLINETNSNRND